MAINISQELEKIPNFKEGVPLLEKSAAVGVTQIAGSSHCPRKARELDFYMKFLQVLATNLSNKLTFL